MLFSFRVLRLRLMEPCQDLIRNGIIDTIEAVLDFLRGHLRLVLVVFVAKRARVSACARAA